MLVYVLICLALSLTGVAGLQFFYLAYMERLDREHRKRIHELERHCKYLSGRLKEAEHRIAEQNEIIESVYTDFGEEEEIWADVIEEK